MVIIEFDKKATGQIIKQLRTQKQLSEEELHLTLPDISIKKIQAWEKGKAIPSLKETILLCNLFKVSMDELIHYRTSIIN